MNFKPLNKRVVVRQDDKAAKTASGIILPGVAIDAPSSGVVVAVSMDVDTTSDTHVSVGSTVIFGKFSGVTTTIEGEEYIIVDKVDLLGVTYAK